MRTLDRNKQNMYYALQGASVPDYERDSNGNIIYDVIDGVNVPRTTGETTIGYSVPVQFRANFSESGGEATEALFGMDTSNYDAIISADKGAFPLTETSLIWKQSTPTYLDDDHLIVNPKSADYKVVKSPETLNEVRYVLQKVVK